MPSELIDSLAELRPMGMVGLPDQLNVSINPMNLPQVMSLSQDLTPKKTSGRPLLDDPNCKSLLICKVFYAATPTHKQHLRSEELEEIGLLVKQLQNGSCTGSTIRRLYRLSMHFPCDGESDFNSNIWNEWAGSIFQALFKRLEFNASVNVV